MIQGTLLAVIGLVCVLAFLFSMLGLGGALLYVPLFNWFGYDFKTVAIPTGLFLNGLTASSASVYYLRSRMVDVRGAVPMIITSLLGAPLGAVCTRWVPTQALIVLFAIGMVAAGGRMWGTSGQAEPGELAPFRRRAWMTGIAGLFIGFLAGLLGIGGGFLFVPILMALGYPTKQAAATSAFIVIFSSFSGFAGHAAAGHYHWPLLLGSAVAVVLASQLGARVMRDKMKARWIKQIFGVVLIGVAIKLAWPILL
jgi:uncharacterized membrane protein YfcA